MNKNESIGKRIFRIILPLIIWLGITFIVQNIMSAYYLMDIKGTLSNEDMINIIYSNSVNILFVSSIINIIVFYFILKKNNNINLSKETSIKCILITLFLGISLYMISMGIINFFDLTKYFPGYNDAMNALTSSGVFLTIIVLDILQPISEEMIFRGVIYNRLKNLVNIKLAIILQGLIFGLVHMNFLQGIYALLISILFAYVYERSGNLIYPILCHMAFNFGNTLFTFKGFNYIYNNEVILVILGVVIGIVSFKLFLKEKTDEKINIK